MPRYSSTKQPRKNVAPLSTLDRAMIDGDRELVKRGGLRTFIKLAWHVVEPSTKFKPNWHIDAMADHLEAVYRGDIRQLVINVPPGCMKSRTTCVFWPAWAWIQNPGLAWMFASFDGGLTLRDSKHTLELLQSEWFRNRWGSRVTVSDDAAGGDYETLQGGFRFATSVEGKATGRHPDIVVVDDPIKPKNVTKVTLEATEAWWRNTMVSRRKDPQTVRRVLIMQRLHERDLAGVLLAGGGWEHVRLPMRFEAAERSSTPIWQDPRTVEGELLWPAHIPEAEVAKLELDMRAQVAAAQLQQRPSPAGGSFFKREWFKEYRRAAIPQFDVIVQSWDCTFKDGDGTDRVAGQVWGRAGSRFYLLDRVARRMSFTETVEAIKAMRRKWPKASAILIEDKANGPAVESVLGKDIPGIIMVNPQGGKIARANPASAFFEAGNVLHPDPELLAEDGVTRPDVWVDEHREELATFPTGAHDDEVDACTQALIWLNERRSNLSEAMAAFKLNPNLF